MLEGIRFRGVRTQQADPNDGSRAATRWGLRTNGFILVNQGSPHAVVRGRLLMGDSSRQECLIGGMPFFLVV